jgi:hypothetical protein
MRQQFLRKKEERYLRSFQRFETILFGCIVGFVVGTFINAFFPQAWNWGNHLLAFFPLSMQTIFRMNRLRAFSTGFCSLR